MNDDRIETYDAMELWLHGVSDEHPDRRCPNCSETIDLERLVAPDEPGDLLLCPECGAELPWGSLGDVPTNDWFNWACLEKVEYDERQCFDEPTQNTLRLNLSLMDPRGSDVGLELTRTTSGDVLVKVDNCESFTYHPYVGTTVEGSYTVVRFRRR